MVALTSKLYTTSSFIVRMLYKDIDEPLDYSLLSIYYCYLDCAYFAFCQSSLKRIYEYEYEYEYEYA